LKETCTNFDIENSPLQEPPEAIASRGLEAMESYFQEIERGSQKSRKLKVVLVGDGEAGKTSLRQVMEGLK